MIEYSQYLNVILDFDGVILDSNKIKEEAIREVSKKYLDEGKFKKFIEYFINNNGIAREIKIAAYFKEKSEYEAVLAEYNQVLKNKLSDARLTRNCQQFLDKLKFYGHIPYILSGGDEAEIKSLLEEKHLTHRFKGVMGGPLSKYENLKRLSLKGKILYIGDSRIDYEVAEKYNLDFIFMYGYTQFDAWKEYFKDKKNVVIIKNFEALTYSHC